MTHETMPGAAQSDARANGPSVAEIVKDLRAEAEKAEPSWSSGVDPEVLNRAADMLEASAQQISAPLPIPREKLIGEMAHSHYEQMAALRGRERQLEEALRDLLACEAKCDDGDPKLKEARTKARAALAGAQPKDGSSS